MDDDGGRQTRLTNDPAMDSYPAWSPDGARIAFTGMREGDMEIFVMPAHGGEPVNLTRNQVDDAVPSWSPDGAKIAFQHEVDGNWAIAMMDADGSNQEVLTDTSAWFVQPKWSPVASGSTSVHQMLHAIVGTWGGVREGSEGK